MYQLVLAAVAVLALVVLALLGAAAAVVSNLNAASQEHKPVMEVVGGGKGLFSQIVTSSGRKGALSRARVFLEKAAWRSFKSKDAGIQAVKIMQKGDGDATILIALRTLWRSLGTAPKTQTDGRAAARLKEGAAYFEREKKEVAAGYRYLDVGSSEGSITAAVAAELGLGREQAVATDVAPQKDSPDFEFVQVDGQSLPFPDAAFDLITMYMSAHHFVDAPRMFAEAARVAKPGARLILREHGDDNPAATLFYDFAHAYYETIAGDEDTPEGFAARYAKGSYATYRTADAWIRLAKDAGFVCTDWTPPLKDTFDTTLIRFVRT